MQGYQHLACSGIMCHGGLNSSFSSNEPILTDEHIFNQRVGTNQGNDLVHIWLEKIELPEAKTKLHTNFIQQALYTHFYSILFFSIQAIIVFFCFILGGDTRLGMRDVNPT